MRSAGGEYFVGLDHVRAFAAFMVFSWHFMHVNGGHRNPLPGTSDFFVFSYFAQGFTGVSIFMVLSGYLFAKLTQDRELNAARFFSARALRLLPLLVAVCALILLVQILKGDSAKFLDMAARMAKGPIFPTLPNGGWSITVEFHFYLLFPLILLMERRIPFSSLGLVAIAAAVRIAHAYSGSDTSAHYLAYGTIFGRIDQFVAGILLAYYGGFLKSRHAIAVVAALGLFALYWTFANLGGFHGNASHPNVWIFLLTLEGILYGTLIAWYDLSFKFSSSGLSGALAKVGAASYSIYLLHFFVVFRMAHVINDKIILLDSFYKTILAALVCFVPMSLVGWISYRYFELFWLRFRRPYVKAARAP